MDKLNDTAAIGMDDPFDLVGESFLIQEGLDMLADYRSIRDTRTRLLLKDLIASLAERDKPLSS